MTEVPAGDDWLDVGESERLRSMPYTKRREEARLGRWTAKRALAHVLRQGDDPSVLRRIRIVNATDGAPEAYGDGRRLPLSISMTDRADWAVCAVLAGRHVVGCDLELVEPRGNAFIADYLTPYEQDLVTGAPDRRDLLANLLWSAKESTLKVLRTGLRRDTRSVEIRLAPHDPTARGWSDLYAHTTEGFTFTGGWRRFGAFVLTYVTTTVTVPPVPLLVPCPLEGAVPAHSWMDRPRTPSITGD